MKRHYCTLFDRNYLPHFLTLFESLENHGDLFSIYCLCMDEDSYDHLVKVDNERIIPISLKEVEEFYPELLAAKANRSKVEYYFTCSSVICTYVFDTSEHINLITYLDADLFFFASPDPIYEELENASIGIIAHKFHGIGRRYEKYGKFNVGWVSFRNDSFGRKCLKDWKKDCLHWCYDRLEGDKFGDQKYLDSWADKYERVKIIQHSGANLAPWNVGQYKLSILDSAIMVGSSKLIFYHFASFKQIGVNEYTTNVSKYFVPLKGILRENIYKRYLISLRENSLSLGIRFIKKDRFEYRRMLSIFQIKELSRYLRMLIYHDTIRL